MMPDDQNLDYKPLNAVKGLAFRHFAGEQDYQCMLDLWDESRNFSCSEWSPTLQDVKQDEHRRQNYEVNQHLFFVELNHKPVGYFHYNWQIEDSPKTYVMEIGIVLIKDCWGGNIPQLMLDYVEEKLIKVSAAFPEDYPRFYHVWNIQKAVEHRLFFEKNGYQPDRYFFMMARPIEKSLDHHPLPEGIEIRPAKPEHYRKIFDAANEAFRDHWGFQEPTEEQFQSWQKGRLFQPHLWKVAWDGDEVAGQAGNYVDHEENQKFNRTRAATENISVRRPWRNHGLAKALIAESIRMFKDMGYKETVLGVDSTNPSGALKLYTDMGYVEEKDKTSIVLRKKL